MSEAMTTGLKGKKHFHHTSSHEKALGNVLKGKNIEGKKEKVHHFQAKKGGTIHDSACVSCGNHYDHHTHILEK